MVLERCSSAKCLEREQYWIDSLQSANQKMGFNISPTAGSQFGFKHSAETKARISIIVSNPSAETRQRMRVAHLGKSLPIEVRQKMGLRGTSHPMHGKHHSQSSNQKNRLAHLGKKATILARENMHKGQLGRVQPPEVRRKISEARKGMKFSLSTRKKLSLIAKSQPRKNGRWAKQGANHADSMEQTRGKSGLRHST
jgi:group I intron endonuclease